ncbi:MAG: glycosyltransferase [Pseudomonadota bacterium]|jgi:glycosyltransferase involved in cell wall biosynthesis
MMRPGDKLTSYVVLAQALQTLLELPWRLAVIGDGEARADVLTAFSAIPPDRIDWLGQLEPEAVLDVLSACDIYVWPGIGEAYGMAYLEAQAMGLPVVAQDTAGVSAVVQSGVTGRLTPAGDLAAFAAAVKQLLLEPGMRNQMGHAATRFVREQRNVAMAADVLRNALFAIVPVGRGDG